MLCRSPKAEKGTLSRVSFSYEETTTSRSGIWFVPPWRRLLGGGRLAFFAILTPPPVKVFVSCVFFNPFTLVGILIPKFVAKNRSLIFTIQIALRWDNSGL